MAFWSKEEIDLLRLIYPNGEESEMERVFKRKFKSISEYARKLGIFRTYKKNNTVWTKENLDFLIENFSSMDFDKLEKQIGTNTRNIQSKAYSMGLKRDLFWWTDEKLDILKVLYLNDTPIEDICRLIGNPSECSVMAQANKIGLKRTGKYWSKSQISFLKENYYEESWSVLMNGIGRSRDSIRSMAEKLGLKRKKYFTEFEDEYIMNNYSKISAKDIALFIGRSESSVIERAAKIGARKIEVKEHLDNEEMLKRLSELAVILNRCPVGRELSSFGLPSETTYANRFGSYSKSCELAGLEMVPLYGRRCFSKNGDLCLSSSEYTITNFFIDNNIWYIKDAPYKKYINGDNTTKTVDWVLEDGSFVEYFGLPNKPEYLKKMNNKIEICKSNQIELIQLFYKDLKKLKDIFKKYLV